MKVPNEKDLYSEENLIYGNNKVSANSKSGNYRPTSVRGNSFFKMLAYGMGEKILRKSPTADKSSVIGGIYNSLRSGLIQSMNAGKHTNGQIAFQNNIPGLKKVIQNLYSFYHLKDGVTTIDEVYTLKCGANGGKEYMLMIHGEKDPSVPTNGLHAVASKIVGDELALKERAGKIRKVAMSDEYVYKEAEKAGVYHELTDGDIMTKKIRDFNRISPLYHNAELSLFGAKGKKSVVATGTANGQNYTIYKYAKPSAAEYWRFYAELDLLYSATGITAGAAERMLRGIGGQRIYLTEINNVINSVINRYGGSMNPLSPTY